MKNLDIKEKNLLPFSYSIFPLKYSIIVIYKQKMTLKKETAMLLLKILSIRASAQRTTVIMSKTVYFFFKKEYTFS